MMSLTQFLKQKNKFEKSKYSKEYKYWISWNKKYYSDKNIKLNKISKNLTKIEELLNNFEVSNSASKNSNHRINLILKNKDNRNYNIIKEYLSIKSTGLFFIHLYIKDTFEKKLNDQSLDYVRFFLKQNMCSFTSSRDGRFYILNIRDFSDFDEFNQHIFLNFKKYIQRIKEWKEGVDIRKIKLSNNSYRNDKIIKKIKDINEMINNYELLKSFK